jgi:hypothetical protein
MALWPRRGTRCFAVRSIAIALVRRVVARPRRTIAAVPRRDRRTIPAVRHRDRTRNTDRAPSAAPWTALPLTGTSDTRRQRNWSNIRRRHKNTHRRYEDRRRCVYDWRRIDRQPIGRRRSIIGGRLCVGGWRRYVRGCRNVSKHRCGGTERCRRAHRNKQGAHEILRVRSRADRPHCKGSPMRRMIWRLHCGATSAAPRLFVGRVRRTCVSRRRRELTRPKRHRGERIPAVGCNTYFDESVADYRWFSCDREPFIFGGDEPLRFRFGSALP